MLIEYLLTSLKFQLFVDTKTCFTYSEREHEFSIHMRLCVCSFTSLSYYFFNGIFTSLECVYNSSINYYDVNVAWVICVKEEENKRRERRWDTEGYIIFIFSVDNYHDDILTYLLSS